MANYVNVQYTVKVELVSLLQLKTWFLRWQNWVTM